MKRLILVIFAIYPLLTGCSFLSPVKLPPITQYILYVPNEKIIKSKKNKKIIYIATPDIRVAFNTTRMAYSLYPYQISYYALNEWAETPAQLMQNVLIQGFTASNKFKSVVAPPFSGHVNYVLTMSIFDFNQNFQSKQPYFELQFTAQLINPDSNHIIRSRDYFYHIPMAYRSPYAGVYAANYAAQRAVNDLLLFIK